MMSLAIKQPVQNRANILPDAANEHHGDVGQTAIAAMRQMLGKTSAASQFDKLTAQQRALVFFAARLKPSEYINKPLLSLSTNEREAVRQSLIALTDLGRAFSNMPLSRDQFISPRQIAITQATAHSQNHATEHQAQPVDDEFARVTQQAHALMSEFNYDAEH
ncbi:hypothetical protein [Shewanella subflava]|uniref:Uncharacterized protein n=1 Tax=Shewanella subflava TaxID=2986476 RepID=A0ABT3I591_9GAMM|nr:hypothetical protein [Shewanella subflava]MCW3171244.1 hypothetical protein [Shewanella subflava]